MAWLDRAPGRQRAPAGLEWRLWRRLPALMAWGSALPIAVLAWLWFTAPALPTPAQERELLLAAYRLLGVVGVHWSLVLAAEPMNRSVPPPEPLKPKKTLFCDTLA